MRIKEGQIFNLMDTNGRRNDVINALQGYLTILDDIQNEQKMNWASMPESLAQYEFYRQAIELSPEVFGKHGPYDKLAETLERNKDFATAVQTQDMEWIQKNSFMFQSLVKQFDLGIEDRARHYTSNLVKLGFTDEGREISPVGELLLDLKKLRKDDLETMLPIDGVNIVYLRQLMKLRLFDTEGERYYSPFNLAIFALLKRHRLSENEFSELVQGLSPYSDFSDIEQYVLNYREGDIVSGVSIDIPAEIHTNERVSETVFRDNYKNRKSNAGVDIYWVYYNLLFDYLENPSSATIDKLLTFFENNKAMLNKAFGCGQNIFTQKTGDRPTTIEFAKQYKKMFEGNLNIYIFKQFSLSKILDQIREYSDTTKRIFKATGIISFDNGFVELAYRELCACIFEEEIIKNRIAGSISEELHSYYDCYAEYEEGINSFYCDVTSLSQILEYYEEETKQVEDNIQKEFPGATIEEIPVMVADKRRKEFAEFIDKNYPAEKVKEILGLFSNRSNDKFIKDIVSLDATVPTIYEYVVGIAWYYFSGKIVDILSSYNLTLSANFEPLVHAGGGQGDIVIYEADKVVMLEATLMNASSQKRGEWEPVLRHSINLKVEEETANTGREVTSFFIADSFDYNTINIWKAVAAVPLQSSNDKDKFTDNVVIMPVNTDELSSLIDKSSEYDEIISKVHKLFEVDKINFDIEWREKFMGAII
ncbi:AlwI family type II restriction endonuclease [Dorea sp. AM13-35]|uniref:AlwI family type II restriction endonuclease n=1 Tax=Dorea sp. AM13-35 TaxID=2293099 RepID=UPI000E47CC4B|nr:AlwI family type II restriction endonuclease [Dorea sp. AM13-35]RHO38895.1 AlwI family type II restriction endonuclease [Dorea sp. AM13-35]